MTTTAKIGIFLVIILVIVMIVWTIVQQPPKTEPEVVTNVIETPTPTPTPKLPNTAGTGMSDINDNSLEAVEVDLGALGKQLTELNSDTAGIDYGINVVNK